MIRSFLPKKQEREWPYAIAACILVIAAIAFALRYL